MKTPQPDSPEALTIKDRLWWLLWQITDRSMIDLTADPRAIEFVNKVETSLDEYYTNKFLVDGINFLKSEGEDDKIEAWKEYLKNGSQS